MNDSQQPPANQTPPGRHGTFAALAFGLVFIGMGMPFVLMWAGIITPDPSKLKAPLWVVGCAGMAFVLAGLSFVLNAPGATLRRNGSLPETSPRPLRIAKDATSLGIIILLALVATWAAVGTGEIKTTISAGGITSQRSGDSTIGRIVFAAGAALCWIFVLFAARQMWRKHRAG
ncbi:MAG: hypothetical protein Q7J60_23205 [Bradyrhizobium sp.]|uniref:hypothetical protein n=1 Tax=Bradyrhizobium sp. TaxID=376 RepID=UPI002718DA80|nr:hypothetical protein [Bradyrhizobium sp.]MDO9564541.1 hypothetical protein [Bradyrhizobium sp.]MDP3691597.1 hypothetical protein [Bradyrhizobium sp.]